MKPVIAKNSSLEEIYNPIIRETLFFTQLENGLSVHILPKKGFHQKYAIFSTNYGSLDNCFCDPIEDKKLAVPQGIAHFLEHKMFENSELDVFDRFASYGANINAYTTYTMTSYLFDTIENFPDCLHLLLDFVQSLSITDESVEKEKGIIEQEILMYEDDPEWISYLNLMRVMFHQHAVRSDIAGTVESVYQIDRQLLLKCHEIFYHPSNMVLFVAGDVDPLWIVELVNRNQEKKGFLTQPPIKRFYPHEPSSIYQQSIKGVMALSRPIYYLGFKEQQIGHTGDKLLKKDLVTGMLLELIIGKGSHLYQRLYESGLIDDSFSVSVTAEIDHGMTVLGGQTNHPEQLHRALSEGIAAARGKLTEDELERVKKRMIGDYIVTFDSLKLTAQNFVSYFFKEMNLFQELKIIREITLKDLNHRLDEHFNYQNHCISIMYPEER